MSYATSISYGSEAYFTKNTANQPKFTHDVDVRLTDSLGNKPLSCTPSRTNTKYDCRFDTPSVCKVQYQTLDPECAKKGCDCLDTPAAHVISQDVTVKPNARVWSIFRNGVVSVFMDDNITVLSIQAVVFYSISLYSDDSCTKTSTMKFIPAKRETKSMPINYRT